MTEPIPLWLDCDPGHDDAFALLLAANHPGLHLLGVSTVHGNASLAQTTTNALSLLTAIGRPDVPVYAGTAKPFCRRAVHAPDIHGATGIDGTDLLPPPAAKPRDGPAVQAMAEALLKCPPGTAWVVATGALTNVALLFAAYPALAEHVAGVSIMGGSIGGGFTDAPLGKVDGEGERFGNTTPWAEFNIYCDPEASHSILSHPVLAPKTVLIPLDLTHLVLATPEIQARLLGPPLHDPLAVAIILETTLKKSSNPRCEVFDDKRGERFIVGVVTDGRHLGDRTDGGEGTIAVKGEVGQVGRTLVKPVSGPGVRIPRGVDLDWFWGEILEAVNRAEVALQKSSA